MTPFLLSALSAGCRPLLAGRFLRSSGLEIELSLALLIEDAIASRPAATHVHPVGGHHDDRAWPEVPGGCSVRPGVPDAADDYVL
jgi:hypothetical protein